MFDELPRIQFSEVITAHGVLHADHETAPVARFRLSRAKHDVHSPWEFEIFVSEERRRDFNRALRVFPKFIGETSTGHTIEIPRLHWRRWTAGSGTLTGVVREVLIDPDVIPSKPDRQVVTIDLSPTPLALQEKPFLVRSYTGEITDDTRWSTEDQEPDPSSKKEVLFWDSAYGRVKLVCYYQYENARVGESESLVRIPVSTLQLRLEGDATSSDPRGMAESIAKEIEGPLQLMSYLSRSHVRWSAMLVTSQFEDAGGRPQLHEMHSLRAGVLGDERGNPDRPLVNAYNMVPDRLNTMVAALRGSPYREVLQSAMIHLVTAFESRIVESKLVAAFTALETLTNGMGRIDGSDRTLDAAAFKKLRRHVEGMIGAYASDQGIPDHLLSSVLAKLSELNRPPVVPRVRGLLERYAVECNDLWSEGSLDEGLRGLFDVRNRFLHTGHIESVGRAEIAAQRAHVLGERLIYKILGGQLQWLDITSYSHVDPLRAWEQHLSDSEKGV